MKKLLATTIVTLLLVGCASFSKTVVTVTAVVDSAMKEWAALSVNGKTTPSVDAKVVQAHNTYRASCAIVQTALIKYKETGDQAPYLQAFAAARAAADGLLELITPLLLPEKATDLKTKLSTAKTL